MQNVGKYHPDWMYEYNNEILQKKKEVPYRRQMLPQKMHSDGHTFIFRINKFLDNYNNLTDYNREYIFSVFVRNILSLTVNQPKKNSFVAYDKVCL